MTPPNEFHFKRKNKAPRQAWKHTHWKLFYRGQQIRVLSHKPGNLVLSWDALGRRREPVLASCILTSTHTHLAFAFTHMQTDKVFKITHFKVLFLEIPKMHIDILRILSFLRVFWTCFFLRRNPAKIPQNIDAVEQRDREFSLCAKWWRKHLEKKALLFPMGNTRHLVLPRTQSKITCDALHSPNRYPEATLPLKQSKDAVLRYPLCSSKWPWRQCPEFRVPWSQHQKDDTELFLLY